MKYIDFIKKSDSYSASAVIAKFLIDYIELYESFLFPDKDCTFTQDEIEAEIYSVFEWLETEMPDFKKFS